MVRRRSALARFSIGACALATALACSSIGKDGGSSGQTERKIERLFITKMRVRRPKGAGADPKAGPGGIDYRSNPLPNEKLDCETLDSLFDDFDFDAIRACIGSFKEAYTAQFVLKREHQPYLELAHPEDAPRCLAKHLARLPVPREIVFQSPEEKRNYCYTARLDLERNQTWGELKLPTNKIAVAVEFPMNNPPVDDDETLRLLGSWVLTPLFEIQGATRFLKAKILPERLCKLCVGEKDFIRENDPGQLLWP